MIICVVNEHEGQSRVVYVEMVVFVVAATWSWSCRALRDPGPGCCQARGTQNLGMARCRCSHAKGSL